MMKKLFLFLLFSILGNAQTHRFIYEFKFKEDSTTQNFRKENMVLDVNPTDVKFYSYGYVENDSINKVRNFKNVMWDDALPAITRKNQSNTNTSFLLMNDFFTYQTEDNINWVLTSETKKSAQYILQKATTRFGGRDWVAWFNKDIEIQEGPYKFRGLPGLIFEIADTKDNFSFVLIKSHHLRKTYDTTEFLESFAGMKPIAITEKILQKKQIEMFNDPLRDFKEHYKNSNGSGKFLVMGVEVKSADQFRELTQMTQERLRKTNNPLELDKAPIYPKK